jgi:MerR family transcriptional regulator, redox-sensitive transcriptional activator SoxR
MGFTIGEVATRSHNSCSAIRYYEKEGLIPRVARISGRRIYDPSILARLRLISLARSADFGINEIKELLGQFSGESPPNIVWQRFASQKLAELDKKIEDMLALRKAMGDTLNCLCPNLANCDVLNQSKPM